MIPGRAIISLRIENVHAMDELIVSKVRNMTSLTRYLLLGAVLAVFAAVATLALQ